MSRNVRHRSNVTPTKKSARRTKTVSGNSSSSDDYEGVDLISDSDEEEKDVEKAEVEALINEISDEDLQTTPRPSQDDDQVSFDGSYDDQASHDDQSSWNGFTDQDQVVLGDQPFFDEHMARAGLATEATLYPTISSLSDDEPGTRRVRFDLGSDSSSTISDDSNHGFPDLFVDQNELDPYFRREVENDADEDRGSSDGGFWDFEHATMAVLSDDDQVDANSESSAGTDESGYSTDDGETTEEDLPEIRCVRPAHSVLRQPSRESSSEEEEIVPRRSSPKTPRAQNGRNGPRMGVWSHTPDRPFAMIDPATKRMLIFKAKIKGRRYSFNDAPRLPTTLEGTTAQEISPMISNSANLMMSAMYGGLDSLDFLGGQVLGPPEAFFPFTSINSNGEMTRDSPSSFDEDDLDENDFQFLAMDDLIAFPEEEEDDDQDETGSPTDGEGISTPRPTTTTSEDQVHPLLMSHPGLVGAFRNNQNNHRILSGSNVSQNSLLFSGRFNSTAIQGIREGHITAAGTPITPMRKKKPAMDSSPLAAHQSKRKFDREGEQRGHKRTKSMN